MFKNIAKSLLFLVLFGFIFLLPHNKISSEAPDYYTGAGAEYDVRYYSYCNYNEKKNEYKFLDELPVVDLELGTFYKVIREKGRDDIIVGAFYLIGKLNWAVTFDERGNVIRFEQYDEHQELISDKHYSSTGELFYEYEAGTFPVYQPRYNRRPNTDISYVYAYITKGQGLEIVDRRDITKWYPSNSNVEGIRERYYDLGSGNIVKESLFGKNYEHLYDKQFYYDDDKIEYTEYYSDNELRESAFYVYKGDELSEIEYRGRNNDKGIVREIYDKGKLAEIIEYYIYYLPEVVVQFDRNEKPRTAIHNRYDSTFRLIKSHHYEMVNGNFDKETVKNVFDKVYEEVEYDYSGNNLVRMKRQGIREGNEYTVELTYKLNSDGKVVGASSKGTYSGSLSYNYDNYGNLIDIKNSSSGFNMTYYTNSFGNLNIDVMSSNGGLVYDKEEKVIAKKVVSSNSIITLSNKGEVIKYEELGEEETTAIHFDEGKIYIYETFSTETGEPIYREYYDKGGNKYKTISYDPEKYRENFIEYDEKGNIVSEYRLDAEGILVAKLFYDDKEKPYLYEEYSKFGIVTFYSVRTYSEDTGRLLNYSGYTNYGEEGFHLSSVMIYGEGNSPELVVLFDDKSHLVSSVQVNNKEGEKTRFVWRKISGSKIKEVLQDYVRDTDGKNNYNISKRTESKSSELKEKDFYSNIR